VRWCEREDVRAQGKMLLLNLAGVGWHTPAGHRPVGRRAAAAVCSASIELQHDSYGRGNQHLSYDLEEGDVVAYQTGTWLVDSVEVGDGSPAKLNFARVDVVQINWTHNCEHGMVHGTALHLAEGRNCLELDESNDEDGQIQFGPEQLIGRFPCTWTGSSALMDLPLPPEDSLLVGVDYEPSPVVATQPRASPPRMCIIECTEDNVEAMLDSFKAQSRSMFGCHEEAARIGITGDITLDELDGPIVVLALSGRFWHKRETVLRNAGAFLMRAIPEIADVVPSDDEDLLDRVYDEETVRAP
jgi:hypothetical protein